MIGKILAPLDSSKVAELVLPYVEELAGRLNSEVTLLYVCKGGEEQYQRVHEIYLGIIADGVKSNIREHYPGKKGARIKVKPVVLAGKPFEEIYNYAEKNEIGLIVVSTRFGSGIMHRSMGHIPSKLVEKTRLPLLLVPTTAEFHPEPSRGQLLDRVLVPLDGSERGEAVLPYVAELAQRQRAQVTLLQVVSPGQHVHTVGGLDYVKFTEQEIEWMKANARQYLENVGEKLASTKALVRCEVRVGGTNKEIISFANQADVRLVVITARRYSGLGQWISGSIAYKLLQATNKPLLLVRAWS